MFRRPLLARAKGLVQVMKLLIGLVIFSGALFGQGANTVYQQMFNAQVSTGPSATARNIGAQYQQLTVTTSQVGTVSPACSTFFGGGVTISLEASENQTTWFQIGTTITSVDVGKFGYISVAGAFPYVRVNLKANASGGACAVSAWYAGTLTGSQTGTSPNLSTNDYFKRVGGSPSATAVCPAGTILAIYGMTVSNNALLPAAGDVVFSTNGSFPSTVSSYAFATAGTLIWPQSDRPWWVSPTPVFNQVDVTSSVAFNVSFVSMTYRCE